MSPVLRRLARRKRIQIKKGRLEIWKRRHKPRRKGRRQNQASIVKIDIKSVVRGDFARKRRESGKKGN